MAQWKEKAKELQQELNKAIMKNSTLLEEMNDLKETTKQLREATCPNSRDAFKHFDNEREPIAMQVPLQRSLRSKCQKVCYQIHSMGDGMGKFCFLVRFCLSLRMNCTNKSNSL